MSAAACAKILLCGMRGQAEIGAAIETVEAYPKQFKEADLEQIIQQLWEAERIGKELNEFIAAKLGGSSGGGY